MAWRRRATRDRRRARDPRTVPSDLRIHLPLLWPAGPDGPMDDLALQALSREYARSGRRVEDLLGDLDQLCSVLGIGASSRMIETSTVAWADAFLDTVGGSGADAAESLAEVERRVLRPTDPSWRELTPGSWLLVASWPTSATDEIADLHRIAEEIGAVFPGAAVATQTAQRRVVAAIGAGPDLGERLETLRARCSELVRSTPPTLRVVREPAADDEARRVFRRTA